MLISAAQAGAPALAPATNFKVWDTQYLPSRQAFGIYREAICQVYMPWSPELSYDGEFHARIESTEIGRGSVARHRCTPHFSARNTIDIASSPRECSYLVHVIDGQSECRQRGRETIASPGDILVLDSGAPTQFTMGPLPADLLVITIPKEDIAGTHGGDDDRLGNVILKHGRTPLAKCVALIAECLIGASDDELAALYNAAVSLLPVEAGCFRSEKKDEDASARSHYMLRGILAYIDQNISNADLSPTGVAEQFGISVRYVHKLFIGCRVTFCSYTNARRLSYICKDLVSAECRQQTISLIAFRWGFNDLSTFNRAFKTRYACTPREFRARSGA